MAWHELLYQILTYVNNAILCVIGIPFALQIFYMIFFWVKKKTYKKTTKLNRVAIIICARNEENVIYTTVKAIFDKQKYPRELFDVYVVANNCTDKTFDEAKRAGATVYKLDDPNPKHHRVSYPLQFGFKKILDMKKYDFLIRLDADNHINDEFISIMNDAFNAGCKIARPYESCLNITDSTFTKACGLYYVFDSRFSSRVRERFGLDAHVNGPGSMFATEVLEKANGFDAFSITEDVEFNFKRMFDGYRCHYVEDAIVYEDFPSTFKDTYARNRRFGAGVIRLLGKYGWKLIVEFFKTLRFSYIENLFSYFLVPICALLCTWIPLYYIYALSYLGAVGRWDEFYLILIVIATCVSVLFLFAGVLQGLLLVILDYKKMGVKKRKELLSGAFIFPLFSVVYIVTFFFGIFSKPTWMKVNRNVKVEEKE